MDAEKSQTQLRMGGMIMPETEVVESDRRRLGSFDEKKTDTFPACRAVPIDWGSFKSPRVATSTFAA